MENVEDEIKLHVSLKKTLEMKEKFVDGPEKKSCCPISYYYKKIKFTLTIFINTTLFDFLCLFNPNFSISGKIPVSTPTKNQAANNKMILSDKLDIDFDEEERNPADFREIALYIKKDPKVVLKEGINVQSLLNY